MKLFIANATRQVFQFAYRVLENAKLRVQDIGIGEQILVPGDFGVKEIDYILDQHKPYGLIEVKDIDRTKDFAGICYQIDRPIAVAQLQRAMEKKVGVLVERGKTTRAEAALAESALLQKTLEDSERPEGLRSLEMSVVEENMDSREERNPIAEGFRVERPQPEPRMTKAERKAAEKAQREQTGT